MVEKFKIRNKETGEIKKVGLSWILKEINRDRSDEWTPYNKNDWREGLNEMTEWEIEEPKEEIKLEGIARVCSKCGEQIETEKTIPFCRECIKTEPDYREDVEEPKGDETLSYKRKELENKIFLGEITKRRIFILIEEQDKDFIKKVKKDIEDELQINTIRKDKREFIDIAFGSINKYAGKGLTD